MLWGEFCHGRYEKNNLVSLWSEMIEDVTGRCPIKTANFNLQIIN